MEALKLQNTQTPTRFDDGCYKVVLVGENNGEVIPIHLVGSCIVP